MNSILRPFRRVAAAALAACLLVPVLASPAAATSETLMRGLTNVVLAPFDAVLAPVTSAIGIYQNLRNIDDSPGVRLVYPLPAYFYAMGLQIGCAWIRASTGAMEVLPGIPLFFMDADMDPLFDPVDDADALVEIDTPLMEEPLRFGINYTIAAY